MLPLGVVQQQQQGAVSSPYWSHDFTGSAITALSTRLGMQFSVGVDMTVNTLAYYGGTQTGLTERPMIHRVSDDAVIATLDIVSTPTSWVSGSISEVTLVAGLEYTISSRAPLGTRSLSRAQTGITFDPNVTKIRYVYGTSDARPKTTTATVYLSTRFGYQL